ncbi:hypothetical protein B0A48_04915 [Cryoendolithus antarcticus]|uniref:Uncharacterized protein n=1 Tax=Cryoendolithus antarcticus TaxID=1507870 RepID=A0A1V8TDQ9_9PEZI|nr:hypothetical protein B0A48_04915 [Cryoendolithus antarcticus]
MANAHHILDLNWEDLFDFEAWDHDTNVEVGQQIPATASPEHIEEELLGSGDQSIVEITGQAPATIRELDGAADVADLGLLAETSALRDHEMTMTDVDAVQSLPGQTFPNTWTLPDQIPLVGSEEHIAKNGMETPTTKPQFGYTPGPTSIRSKGLQRCMDLMASDWVVRLRVLKQLELHSFAASPQEYAREVRLAAVTEMQAQVAVGRGECVPS